MLFGQTRLLQSAAVLYGSAMALSAIPCILPAAEPSAPIVRTEEDLKKGKENVRAVIKELTELFSDDAPSPVIQDLKRKIAPPYSKVIQSAGDRATLIFRPRFTSSKQMFKALDGVISGSALVEPLDEQNELIINADAKEIESCKAILEAMDVPSPQILIEAKVVEVLFSDGMQRNLSIMFQGDRYKTGAQTEVPGSTNPTTSGAVGDFTPYAGKDSMNIAFQWLETAQDASVLSSPNILISRNEVSRIITGEEIPIQEATTTGTSIQMSTTFKNVGVTLEVEPSMINRDNVTLRVYPKVSNVQRYENVSSGDTSYSVPVISARSVETYLRMQDKQVVMMGGLYSNRSTLQQQRVPFLSDLPYLGELFTGKNESKEVTQLIFFLKIHIISPEQAASGVFYDFDQSAKVSEKLNQIVANSESFPSHEASIKKFKDEVEGALPDRPQSRLKTGKGGALPAEDAEETKSQTDSPSESQDLVTEQEGEPEPEAEATESGRSPLEKKPEVRVTVEAQEESEANSDNSAQNANAGTVEEKKETEATEETKANSDTPAQNADVGTAEEKEETEAPKDEETDSSTPAQNADVETVEEKKETEAPKDEADSSTPAQNANVGTVEEKKETEATEETKANSDTPAQNANVGTAEGKEETEAPKDAETDASTPAQNNTENAAAESTAADGK